jgi:hypothetical protein
MTESWDGPMHQIRPPGRTMHQIVSPTVDSTRRWWVLAIVVAAQFMFGVDAFIVNVAIPTIAAGVAAIGAAFFAIEAAAAARLALFAALALFALSIMTSAAFLSWMRRAAA